MSHIKTLGKGANTKTEAETNTLPTFFKMRNNRELYFTSSADFNSKEAILY